MQITHFCNSFISVSKGKTLLMCDPWIGTANHGGWMSYPITSNIDNIFMHYHPTHIYISHLHTDHFCEQLLNKISDKQLPIIIKYFCDRRLLKKLNILGFKNVIEMPPWEVLKLGNDFEITIIPADVTNADGLADEISYDLDTSILIRSLSDNTFFFNGVDNPMSLSQYAKIKEYVKNKNGKIDIVCLAVGASSEYPQCFLNIDREAEKNKVIDCSLSKFANQLLMLEAEAYFPAGGVYIIPGKFSMLNKYIAQPSLEQLKSVALQNNCKQFFVLEGGSSVNNILGKWVKTDSHLQYFKSLNDAIQCYKNLTYEYSQEFEDKEKSINELFLIAKEKYFAKLDTLSVNIKWKVIFNLYTDLNLNENGQIDIENQPSQTLILSKTNQQADYELICHLDQNLFINLLKRKCIWNLSLSGSIIMFERHPNVFIPEIPFSLNYLAII